MKKSTLIALFIIAFAAALSPVVAYAQPVCAYPAHWIWRGYWNCEYPAPLYYPSSYYPYYGYPYAFIGGFGGRPFFRGGGHFTGGFHGGSGHVQGGFRGGGGGGHSGGGHGGRR